MRGSKPRPQPAAHDTPALPAPSDLKAEAKIEWERIVALLASQRVLSELDRSALWVFATSMAMYRHAQQMIDEFGPVVESSTGAHKPNDFLRVQREAWERVRPLLAEFGLTPSARARLKLDHGTSTDDSGDDF